MNSEFIKQIYKRLQKDSICFVYEGAFTDEMTDNIIGLSENNLESKEEMKKIKKKISFLMAESFQNIVRHKIKSDETEPIYKLPGLFMTRCVDSFYFITSANVVENKIMEELESKLKKVNELNADELKELYRQILSSGELSEKGGAGLGFIEMVRKSGKKLEYDFEPINETHSMFYLRIKMQGNEGDEKKFPIVAAKEFHEIMHAENIMLIYKGDFSRDSILPALKVIEENLDKKQETIVVKKRIFLTLVEMFQNISKHGQEKEGVRDGIFSFGMSANSYSIITANTINSDNEFFKENLKKLKSMSLDDLRKEYKSILRSGQISNKGGAGLGLIDIARECKGNFDYEFYPVNEVTELFILSVKL